jgi:hypothetical protein
MLDVNNKAENIEQAAFRLDNYILEFHVVLVDLQRDNSEIEKISRL